MQGGILLKVHIEDDDSPLTAPDFVDDIIYRLETPASPSKLVSNPVEAAASGRITTYMTCSNLNSAVKNKIISYSSFNALENI